MDFASKVPPPLICCLHYIFQKWKITKINFFSSKLNKNIWFTVLFQEWWNIKKNTQINFNRNFLGYKLKKKSSNYFAAYQVRSDDLLYHINGKQMPRPDVVGEYVRPFCIYHRFLWDSKNIDVRRLLQLENFVQFFLEAVVTSVFVILILIVILIVI